MSFARSSRDLASRTYTTLSLIIKKYKEYDATIILTGGPGGPGGPRAPIIP